MAVPYTFGNATTSIPLSQLDTNFATAITIGNTAVYLGNTTTTFGNVTLTNATISSGNVTVTSAIVPTVIGGTTASSTLTLQSTSGVGTSDAISFKVGNNGATTAMTISTNGSVGVSTSSPFNGGITIDSTNTGTTSANLYFKSQSADADEGVWRQRVFNTAGSAYFEVAGLNDAVSSAAIAWRAVKTSGNVIDRHEWYTNGSERMRIDSSGNVGIGTSSPAGKFDVYSDTNSVARYHFRNANAGSSAYSAIDFGNNLGSSQVTLALNSSTNTSYGGANSFNIIAGNANITFNTNGSERMRLDSSGNLLVGTTATSNITKLTTYNSGLAFITANTNTSNLSTPAMQVSKGDNNTTTSNVLVQFLVNGFATGSGQINANGASAAAFGSFSDRRLKENITELPSQLAKIMALRPVEFDYIKSEGGGHQIGFIAQEVQKIYPDLVGERDDGMLTLTDLNKNDARLIKAFQELAAQVTSLKAELDALKGTK